MTFRQSFTKLVGISFEALLHIILIIGGTVIAGWMQIKTVQESILLPGCIFMDAIILVLVMSALRNLQIQYRSGLIASVSLILFPLGFNIFAIGLMKGSQIYSSFYMFLICGILVLVVNFLIMVSGRGAGVDDGRFIDERRFDNRRQRGPRPNGGGEQMSEDEFMRQFGQGEKSGDSKRVF